VKLLWLIMPFVLNSCSITSFHPQSDEVKKQDRVFFNYQDRTGELSLKKEYKIQGSKLVHRTKLFSRNATKELESTVAVSRLGNIGKTFKSKSILPEVSQFKVWFDKKKYFSQIKLDRKQKSLIVSSTSPEKEYNMQKQFELPGGLFYCYFTQLSECLKIQNLLYKSAKRGIKVYLIWESFPFHNEIYEGLGNLPFSVATLKLDKYNENTLNYSLDLGNQLIILKYNKKLELLGYYWVSQGISAESVNKEM